MALAYEGNTDLAFDTDVLRSCGEKYAEIAQNLTDLATDLDNCLTELKDSGWTTNAGTEFQKMADINWKENMDRYAGLLNTLSNILKEAGAKYDNLVTGHIEKTRIS